MTTTEVRNVSTPDPTPEAPEKCQWCPAVFVNFGDLFGHICPLRPTAETQVRRTFGEVVEVKANGREVVTNGFGGTTTRPAPKAVEVVAPTDRQMAYIRTLLSERAGVPEAEAMRVAMNALREAGTFGKREASKAIDGLLQMPKAAKAAPATTTTKPQVADLPEVPAGHYAIEVEGVVKFYKVDTPTEGKWAGWTFVKVQASDDYFPIKGEARRPILEAIALDPQAATARYGHELGICGVCSRTLTDEESRARGIGPVCAQKRGW